MFAFNLKNLRYGDIILTRDPGDRESDIIRRLSESNYSHAIMYVCHSSAIESTGLRVNSFNLSQRFFKNSDDAIALRYVGREGGEIIDKAIEFVRSKIGTEYGGSELRRCRTEHTNPAAGAKEPNRQICTRLVMQAYEEAGLKLVCNPAYCTLKDIEESPQLTTIRDILVPISQEEIDSIPKTSSINIQDEETNKILMFAQNISGEDIQTIEQVSDLIIRRNELDQPITNFIKNKTDYLNLCEYDMILHPEQYDQKLFNKIPAEYQHIVANELLESKTQLKLFQKNLALIQMCPYNYLSYFQLQKQLYEKLVNIAKTRIAIGESVSQIP